MLNASDILEGASAPADPSVFVVGGFDTRITFYSQQVRGLELAHALKNQGRLKPGLRCAVVGAGAAGLAAASALALLEKVQVVVFETANEVLSLQSASERRRLDPHIFDWPAHNTHDPVAGLPILDWRAGPARGVRGEVKTEFEAIVGKVDARLAVRTRHTVTAAVREGRAIRLDFEFRPAVGAAQPHSEMFDLVILAFGFGLETPSAGYASLPSYWQDGGMPGVEFTGRPEPRFLISGDGDGALIDLVAAASADFSHSAMLAMVTAYPGIDRIIPVLNEIEAESREALRLGQAFDYRAAYDDRVFPTLQQMGLPARFQEGLRPGVHVTLQTLAADPFNVKTATLNRVAAWLVARACADRFVHLVGDLVPVPAPAAAPYDAAHWFKCAGVQVGVHTAIIRHGPDRAAVRAPFADMLEGFADAHGAWINRHGLSASTPRLSPAARGDLERAAQVAELPQACWRTQDVDAAMPIRLAVQTDLDQVVWSGDLALDQASGLWNDTARRVMVFVSPTPEEIPRSSFAVLRLAVHSNQIEMKCDPGLWRAFAGRRTLDSPHGRNIRLPAMSAGAPEGVGLHPKAATDAEIATGLDRSLNLWVLNAIDAALTRYIGAGVDPGAVISVRAHPDVRAAMDQTWTTWRQRFAADPDLLDRFLRLMVCAQDSAEAAMDARILVGPLKLADILRATAVALMVAAGWTTVAPAGATPGNLALARPNGGWSGHACGADFIDRQPLALQAGRYIWRVNFVVLPLTDNPVEVTWDAEASLAETSRAALTLAKAGQPNFILTTDPHFRTAAEAGLAQLAAHLVASEGAHFEKLREAVEELV